MSGPNHPSGSPSFPLPPRPTPTTSTTSTISADIEESPFGPLWEPSGRGGWKMKRARYGGVIARRGNSTRRPAPMIIDDEGDEFEGEDGCSDCEEDHRMKVASRRARSLQHAGTTSQPTATPAEIPTALHHPAVPLHIQAATDSSSPQTHSVSSSSSLPAKPPQLNTPTSSSPAPSFMTVFKSEPSPVPSVPQRLQVSQFEPLRSRPLVMPDVTVPYNQSPALGKRKANDEARSESAEAPSLAASHPPRSSSMLTDIKPVLTVPILPTPIPSKRFKKHPTSKALLLPVEQLPVYALPPLPPIQDAELAKTVFTHNSIFEKVKGRFEEPEDAPAAHYEKLEHVGDSILGMIVTTWLHEIKPRLTCGTATKLKAHLVSNATLSHLSGLYNLPQRLHGDPNLLPVLRAHTDVRAALMEAYIAAVYFSYPPEERISTAMPILDEWLRDMYEPLVDFFFTYMKKEYDQHNAAVGAGEDGSVIVMDEEEIERIDKAAQGMALLVKMYASQHERELKWEEERFETTIGILWRMKCVIDGIELGEATRAGKKPAKNVAGWEAAKKLGLTTEFVIQ